MHPFPNIYVAALDRDANSKGLYGRQGDNGDW